MDNWTISDLIVTALGLMLTWLGTAATLFIASRRAAQKRQEAKDVADASERQREIERNRKDDEIRTALTNEVIRRNDELANQVERLNDERLSEILKLQSDMKAERDRNKIREDGLQRILDGLTNELKQNLEVQTREREFYRKRIDEHAAETSKVIENQGRTLAIAEQLGRDNEDLRRRVSELETKISGYATLQAQLSDALAENARLTTRVEHLEKQVLERDAEIAGLKADIEALKPKENNNPVAMSNTIVIQPEGNNSL